MLVPKSVRNNSGLKIKASVLDVGVIDTSNTNKSKVSQLMNKSKPIDEKVKAKSISKDTVEMLSDMENDEDPLLKKKLYCGQSTGFEQIIFWETFRPGYKLGSTFTKSAIPTATRVTINSITRKEITVNDKSIQNKIQIIHCKEREHWVVGTTIGCDKDKMKIYNTLHMLLYS